MSFYITSIGKSTTGFRESDADKVYQVLEAAVWDEKWDYYGWATRARAALNLEDIFVKTFGIDLIKEDDIYYLEFKEVPESKFFKIMFEELAPYMTEGVMYLDREYDKAALTFDEGKVVEHYGDEAEHIYMRHMFEYLSYEQDNDEDFDLEIK